MAAHAFLYFLYMDFSANTLQERGSCVTIMSRYCGNCRFLFGRESSKGERAMKRTVSVLMVIAIVLAIMPAVVPAVSAEQSGDFTYTVADSKATITGYTGVGQIVTIPDKVGEYPVTAIGNSAFFLNVNITSVTIPAGVTSIGNTAFSGCTGLSSVNIAAGVVTIGESAFLLCTNLTSVNIPDSVTAIGSSAFRGCTALTSLTIGSGVATIGGTAFAEAIRLKEIYFLGNAPVMGDDTLGLTLKYDVYYLAGKTGFTNPWNGHNTAVFRQHLCHRLLLPIHLTA